jgi:hypothetical protein
MESGAQTFTSPQRPTGWFGLAIVAVLLALTFYDGTVTVIWRLRAGSSCSAR